MAYGGLKYHECRFKASHNSYQRNEDLHQQLSWSSGQPWQGGCRGLELDIWRHSDASKGTSLGYFTVAHSSPGSVPLAGYLGHLLSYHANHPGHDPVLVMLDIKSSRGSATAFAGEIDGYLGEWFDQKLVYRPADLRARSRQPQLIDVVRRAGWPRVDELKGRFIFLLSGTESWKKRYAESASPGSLCFADFDVADDQPFDELAAGLPADRVFVNMHVFSADFDAVEALRAGPQAARLHRPRLRPRLQGDLGQGDGRRRQRPVDRQGSRQRLGPGRARAGRRDLGTAAGRRLRLCRLGPERGAHRGVGLDVRPADQVDAVRHGGEDPRERRRR